MGSLMADPHFTVFWEKVSLHPYPKFQSKVSSEFHINQVIRVPVFAPKLYQTREDVVTWDIWRALAFYLDRPKPFRKSLFLLQTDPEIPQSPLRDSQDGSLDVLSLAVKLPTFNLLLGCLPILQVYFCDIIKRCLSGWYCRGATRSPVHTLFKRYVLVHAVRSGAAADNTVLSSVLDSTEKLLPGILLRSHRTWGTYRDTTERRDYLCNNWSYSNCVPLWILHYPPAFRSASVFHVMGLYDRERTDGSSPIQLYIYLVYGAQGGLWVHALAEQVLLLKTSDQRHMRHMCTWVDYL